MTDAAHSRDATDFDSVLTTCGVQASTQTDHDASYADANGDDTFTHDTQVTGRPYKLTSALKEQACILASEGATDREIAAQLDINVMTLYRAKRDDQVFCDALNNWKNVADAEVEKGLFNRARGFTHRTEKVFAYRGTIVRAEVNEYVIPDTNAAIHWLKNRQPDKWRDTKDVNVSLTLESLLHDVLTPLEQPAAIEGEARDVTPPAPNTDTDNT